MLRRAVLQTNVLRNIVQQSRAVPSRGYAMQWVSLASIFRVDLLSPCFVVELASLA